MNERMHTRTNDVKEHMRERMNLRNELLTTERMKWGRYNNEYK